MGLLFYLQCFFSASQRSLESGVFNLVHLICSNTARNILVISTMVNWFHCKKIMNSLCIKQFISVRTYDLLC